MAVYDVEGNNLNDIAYSLEGRQLIKAYDLEGNELINAGLIINDDKSTGTSIGYDLTSEKTAKTYTLRQVIDFLSDSYSYQSFCYDNDNNLYYKFEGDTTVKVYNSSMVKTNTITLPSSAGHNNDSCYYNGNIYFPNANITDLYVWNIANNSVSSLTITGISQPSNGSTRKVDALCNKASGELYLITRDAYTDDLTHQSDDKLGVYSYDISTGVATLLAEFTWDCVYVQGSTYYNGVLYVVCNTQTTGSTSNYAGITLKVIRTDTWELVDELTVSGSFEPEGLDIIPVDNTYEIMMGIGKYSEMSKAVRYTIPYELE